MIIKMFDAEETRIKLALVFAIFLATSALAQSAPPFKAVSFRFPLTVSTAPSGTVIAGVASGDFNHDGRGDVAVLASPPSCGPAAVTVYLGQTDGTMRPGWTTNLNVTASSDLKAGDFHSNGNLDLALLQVAKDQVGQNLRTVTLMPGNGDGTFRPATVTMSGLVNFQDELPKSQVLLGDLDGDRRLDIIIGNVFFRNNGNGTFRNPEYLPFFPILISDLNADGIPDVVSLRHFDYGPSNFVFLGVGGGIFDEGKQIRTLSTLAVIAGDFDGDGKIDLLDSSRPSNLCGIPSSDRRLFHGVGNGTFYDPKSFQAVGGDLLAADFDRDGIPDLLTGFGFALGKGNGEFVPPLWLFTPPYLGPRASKDCGATVGHSVLFDADGDGLTDILYAFNDASHRQPSQLLLFINDGSGDGILASAVPPATYVSAPPAGLAITSVYGIDLSPESATAVSVPLPTTLGGIKLYIGNQLAPLLYVSPSQINYLMPDFSNDTPFYSRTIGIERVGHPLVLHGIAAPSVPEAPAFFGLNAYSKFYESNLAAAYAVRVAADGKQTAVPVADCSQNPCIAVPIDLSGDPVYLSLFATGLNANDATKPPTSFQCEGFKVTYAGPQGSFPGVQQINLLLENRPFPGPPLTLRITCTEKTLNPDLSLDSVNAVNVLIK